MKNISFLIMIIIFWFLLNTTIFYISIDPSGQELLILGNRSLELANGSASFTISDTPGQDQVSQGGFLEMTGRILTFRVPNEGFPYGISLFVSFVNYLLILAGLILLYRIGNPFGGE